MLYVCVCVFRTGNHLSHGCNTWKLNLKVGDKVDAQDSEEFTWWEAEIVSKYCVADVADANGTDTDGDENDNGEDGVKGEHTPGCVRTILEGLCLRVQNVRRLRVRACVRACISKAAAGRVCPSRLFVD